MASERAARSAKQSPRRPTGQDAEVGSRLRASRNAAGLTQEQLAAALGVSYQQVQKYEKGASRIPTARLQQAASVLRTSIQELVDVSRPGAPTAGLGEKDAVPYDAGEPQEAELLRHFRAIASEADRAMIIRMAKLAASEPAASRGGRSRSRPSRTRERSRPS